MDWDNLVPSTGTEEMEGMRRFVCAEWPQRNTRPVDAWKTFDLTLRSPSLLIVGWRCVVRSRPALWPLLALGKRGGGLTKLHPTHTISWER